MSEKLLISKEAESALIGAILTAPDSMAVVAQELTPEMFYGYERQIIYGAMHTLYNSGRKVDAIAVHEIASKTLQPFSIVELIQYQEHVSYNTQIDTLCEIIKDKHLKRQMYQESVTFGSKVQQDKQPANELLNDHMAALSTLNQQTEKDLTLPEMLVQLAVEREARKPGVNGIPTGIASLTDIGFSPSDLVIIAARPGQGKTLLAVNLMLNLSFYRNIPTAFVSLEMSWQQLLERAQSVITDIAHERIKTNLLDYDERTKIATTDAEIAQKPLHIVDMAKCTPEKLRGKIALLKAKYGVQVVFVDYLQLIRTGSKDRYNEITEVSMALKSIAKEYQVCMVALAQLSREVEKRPDKMPQLSDLRESGQIEQDADIVLFLMRPEYYEMGEVTIAGSIYPAPGLMCVKNAKNRHGRTGVTYPVSVDMEKMKIL